MVAKDTVIGVVGAVILVAALTGVFYYEGGSAEGTAGGDQWDVSWETRTVDGPTTDGTTNEEDTTSETLTVEADNITDAEFVLSWTDDTGSADTFNLTVTNPAGDRTLSVEGDSEEIAVAFEGINDVPPEGTVQGSDEAEAHQEAASQYTATRGQGDWTVEVTCVDAGDADPVGAGTAIEEDDGNDWELSVSLDVYEAQLSMA